MMLGIEANQVVMLRMVKLITSRDASQREARLMISEKIEEAIKAGANALAGASSEEIVRQYRRRVAKNKRRLSGSRRLARRD